MKASPRWPTIRLFPLPKVSDATSYLSASPTSLTSLKHVPAGRWQCQPPSPAWGKIPALYRFLRTYASLKVIK